MITPSSNWSTEPFSNPPCKREFTVLGGKREDTEAEGLGIFAALSNYKMILLALGSAIFVLVILIILVMRRPKIKKLR